jgi:CO/xanthine dehydrogenase Mo-binding subunit
MRLLPQRLDHDRRGIAARHPHPSEQQIRDGLSGPKCRCGTHMAILRSARHFDRHPRRFPRCEAGAAVKPPLAPNQFDSWLAIKLDGDAVAYFGKMDMGRGVDVAIAQIVAEELDVRLERVSIVMGDTARTVNQGGASGSIRIQKGGIPLRNAAAEARGALVPRGVRARLGISAAPARSRGRRCRRRRRPGRKVSHSELIGGRYFDLQMNLERQDWQ